GGWRLEAGGWRLEAGGWRLDSLRAGTQPPSSFFVQPSASSAFIGFFTIERSADALDDSSRLAGQSACHGWRRTDHLVAGAFRYLAAGASLHRPRSEERRVGKECRSRSSP